MIAFAVEPFADIAHELPPLWQAHYDEIAQDKEAIPFAPDWGKYQSLDAGGYLVIVTARQAGDLVGYIFAVVDTHIHYATTRFALFDLYFLALSCRGGRNAFRMFQAMERALSARGVVKAIGSTKVAHDQGRLFEALGWREAERVFVKMVGSV